MENNNRTTTISEPSTNCNFLLQNALNRILQMSRMKIFKSAIVDQKLKISSDMKQIARKIENKEYLNADQFLVDVKRMKQSSFSELSNKKRLLRTADEFYICCETDGRLIKSCAECFSNELTDETDKWFTQTCSKPHLLVTVKLKSCEFFPAKIMAFGKETVFVRLFQELSVADVPYNDCLLYSFRDITSKLKNWRTIVKANTGAKLYIETITNNFGQYNYGSSQTEITAQNIAQHLRDMILPAHSKTTTTDMDRTSKNPTSSTHDGLISSRAKRVKLENEETHSATGDHIDDLTSIEGNAGDETIPLEDVEVTENMSGPVSGLSGCTGRVGERMRSQERSSPISMRDSLPILRDCSSRCALTSVESEATSLTLSQGLEKVKRDHQLEISCMAKSFSEILKAVRSQHESELLQIVKETKKKQWCSNCWKEAKLYCCWQTSYCDHLCQRKHWLQHGINCVNEGEREQE